MLYSHNIALLSYQSKLKIQSIDGVQKIYDPIRTKWYVMKPEEMVRQLILALLLDESNYPSKLIGVEKQMLINQQRKRFDILLFDNNANPYILIETKSPQQRLGQDTALQIANYNTFIKAKYLWLSNGHENLFYKMDYHKSLAEETSYIPHYQVKL